MLDELSSFKELLNLLLTLDKKSVVELRYETHNQIIELARQAVTQVEALELEVENQNDLISEQKAVIDDLHKTLESHYIDLAEYQKFKEQQTGRKPDPRIAAITKDIVLKKKADGKTNVEIAKDFKISEGKVRQILKL